MPADILAELDREFLNRNPHIIGDSTDEDSVDSDSEDHFSERELRLINTGIREGRRQETTVIEQGENRLVLRFAAALANKIVRDTLKENIEIDGYIKGTKTFFEAKGSSSRESFRMAIGQLFDYGRYIEEQYPEKLILLPEKPLDSLLELAESLDINVAWETNEGEFEFARDIKGLDLKQDD